MSILKHALKTVVRAQEHTYPSGAKWRHFKVGVVNAKPLPSSDMQSEKLLGRDTLVSMTAGTIKGQRQNQFK